MERNNKSRGEATRKFLKLDLPINAKGIKSKSIYDLKTKIKDNSILTVVSCLMRKIMECDVDPEVYFLLKNAHDKKELHLEIIKLLDNSNSRKYDNKARNILYVLEDILSEY